MLSNIFPKQLFCTVADSEGRTPLHWAVDRGRSNVVELLVSRNADMDVKVFRIYLILFLLIEIARFSYHLSQASTWW